MAKLFYLLLYVFKSLGQSLANINSKCSFFASANIVNYPAVRSKNNNTGTAHKNCLVPVSYHAGMILSENSVFPGIRRYFFIKRLNCRKGAFWIFVKT